MDPSSISDSNVLITEHVDLDWTVDFAKKTIYGWATLSVQKIDDAAQPILVLDATGLIINEVYVDGVQANWSYDEQGGKFGGSLTIDMGRNSKCYSIRIFYSTTCHHSPSALQWLNPGQTLGKKAPFLYSQCQAILARTLLPCQDTPSVKFTYTATVKLSEPDDDMEILMSANKRERNDSTFYFEQTAPIPSYLIAIAAGHLKSCQISPISTIWAESPILEASKWEFNHIPEFISLAEDLCGPYIWGRYDLLVLPPSFPYGGMENPCLTFVTPSLIAGDRSLVSVIIHEITHSWTGNLLTNSTWEHFWLNEGFTKFIERKLIGRIEGEPVRELMAQIGQVDLADAVNLNIEERPYLTSLIPDLSQISPDDAYSIVPYEKGHALLFHLEQVLGGAAIFDPYLREHIRHFSGKSLSTSAWKKFMFEYFSATNYQSLRKLEEIDFDAWLHGAGLPPVKLVYDESLKIAARDCALSWINNNWNEDSDKWHSFSVQQKIIFLDILRVESSGCIPSHTLSRLDICYQLTKSKNVEISLKWFLLAIKSGHREIFQAAAIFATLHGRMKYCRPVLRELFKQPEGRTLAIETFISARTFYHPHAARMIAFDLGINN